MTDTTTTTERDRAREVDLAIHGVHIELLREFHQAVRECLNCGAATREELTRHLLVTQCSTDVCGEPEDDHLPCHVCQAHEELVTTLAADTATGADALEELILSRAEARAHEDVTAGARRVLAEMVETGELFSTGEGDDRQYFRSREKRDAYVAERAEQP